MKKHQKPGKISYSKSDVAVIVPLHKTSFNKDEKISIKQLRLLKDYTRFIVIPDNLKNETFPEFKNFRKRVVEDKFFNTYKGYNQLLKTKEFYEIFKNFKYILIYQTDCLVFKNSLLEICNKNYDYVGAPEFQYNLKGETTKEFIGNGGLSLRKVEPAIKVLEKRDKFLEKLKWTIIQILYLPKNVYDYILSKPPRSISHILTVNEDIFWSFEAIRFNRNFKIAPIKEACKFAIEREIEKCMKMNNGKLPFGAHAYQKYNKQFWLKKLGLDNKTNK